MGGLRERRDARKRAVGEELGVGIDVGYQVVDFGGGVREHAGRREGFWRGRRGQGRD